jgi:lipopolysaccharide export system permease protein
VPVKGFASYILRQLGATVIFITIALAGVVWLSQSLKFLDFIINKGLSFLSFARLTMLLMPTVLSIILPIAAFCAVIYVYNRLNTDRELVVLRAAGLSQWSLAAPALLLAAILTIIGFVITLYAMPAGFRAFKDEQYVLRADYSHVLLQEGVFNSLLDDLTVYVRARKPNGEVLGILVHDARNPDAPVTMMAESGALISTPDGPRFLLINGNRQEVSTEGQAIKMLFFERYTLDLSGLTDAPKDRYREPRERFFHELIGPPLSVSDDEHRGELNAEAHQRLVMPFNVVALTMIGLASMLSGEFNRRRQWPRLLVAALSATVFMSFSFAIGNALIKTPELAVLFYCYPVVTIALAALVLRSTRMPRWLRVPRVTTTGS